MGHLLETLNPDAAARMNGEGLSLPGVSDVVLYHPRPGEVRQGRVTVPAIVLKRDVENRHLELLVIHHSDDLITQERVAEYIEGDRGWSRRPGGDSAVIEALTAQVAALTALVIGDFEKPETSILAMLAEVDERVGAIEDAQAPPVRQPAPSVTDKQSIERGGDRAARVAAQAAETVRTRRRAKRS